MSNVKKCKYCGETWEFSYKVSYNQDGTVICYHDDDAIGLTTTDDEKYHQRLLRRAELLKNHESGKLPKSYYKKDKTTGNFCLLPSHLHKLGY